MVQYWCMQDVQGHFDPVTLFLTMAFPCETAFVEVITMKMWGAFFMPTFYRPFWPWPVFPLSIGCGSWPPRCPTTTLRGRTRTETTKKKSQIGMDVELLLFLLALSPSSSLLDSNLDRVATQTHYIVHQINTFSI